MSPRVAVTRRHASPSFTRRRVGLTRRRRPLREREGGAVDASPFTRRHASPLSRRRGPVGERAVEPAPLPPCDPSLLQTGQVRGPAGGAAAAVRAASRGKGARRA